MKLSTAIIPVLIGIAGAAPKPDLTSQDVAVFNETTMSFTRVADINAVEKRALVGTVWKDRLGTTRALFTLQITAALIQAFDNSGYSLSKAVLSEILVWAAANGFANSVRRNSWSAQFNPGARFIRGVPYMTIAITSRGSAYGVDASAALLSGWMAQGGGGMNVIVVDNALKITTKRSDDGMEELLEERDASTQESQLGKRADYCGSPIKGLYNLWIVRQHERISLDTSCCQAGLGC